MAYLLNLIYLLAWTVALPWLLFRKKPMRGLAAKWSGNVGTLARASESPTAWFHGVSVGEIHLLRQVIARFRQRFPDWRCVVSTTTNTGYDEARKHFADLPVIFWPFDFTWAVDRALRTVWPKLVVLTEGEVWPNFIRVAKRHGVKVALINARMSPRSAKRFRQFHWLLAPTFAKLDLIAVQNDEYRRQYEQLGARNVLTTGNIKYDGVNSDRHNAKTKAMRSLLGISSDALIWVAGSTQAPEEEIAIEMYRLARVQFPNLRLILVPRHPERFDEVTGLLKRSGLTFVRRSELGRSPSPPASLSEGEGRVILGDTMGELNAVWGLADIAFVGGSLDGKRGGQNMIEPSAYGAAVVFGPHTWNFKQTVADLLARDAAVQVADAAALEAAIVRLLAGVDERRRLGEKAREFVLSQQGATERTLDELQRLMGAVKEQNLAA